ncbi:LOW QUALITY PROTEIN: ribosomal protein S6 kinase-related protein [Rhincodon typus]|uniref:LOW QUALITY PROTEIN: ribosomal protein S6 kinase-related protein n=1 Tax=Rhincodon typus TaxID=259920 RepID=UPI00202FCEB2|nr:LOW QUALITY PROTEIN: ribosomal protein S6 kinase-related protein [Rhincodon typus]
MASGRTTALGGNATGRSVSISKWKSVLSRVRSSLCMFQRAQKKPAEPQKLHREWAQSNDSRNTEWPLPQFVSLFFPEFTYRSQQLEWEFQDIEIIAKGSIGPILKVCKRTDEQIYALKVLLKAEIFRQGMLQQCKESHSSVYDYHSTGDLYMLWRGCDSLDEDTVRVFAAELGSAIGFLHDLGIIHRDVKMENVLLNERGHLKLADFGFCRRLCRGERAFTICGTMQYMAPEVLRGGPYNHAADWWSLGILLFALLIGKFPVEPQSDHISMLVSVEQADMRPPSSISQNLTLLLAELLCRDPQLRLHHLDLFSQHRYFHGLSFDPESLQKLPLKLHLTSNKHLTQIKPDPTVFRGFDCDLLKA